jgi:hemolysin-activating ACP:hemolysin acyltransferase
VSEEAKKRAAVALRLSAAFAQIITVLIRSAQHRHLALADLEWLVFPPLTTGQFAVANVQAKQANASGPAALALWASVSPEVDKKLCENLTGPMRLRPDEWKSGDIVWLIEAVGDPRVLPGLLKQLQASGPLKGREVKMRVRGEDGKPAIRALHA